MSRLFSGEISAIIYPQLLELLEISGKNEVVIQLRNPKETVPGELPNYPGFLLCLQLGLEKWTGKNYSSCVVSRVLNYDPSTDQVLFESFENDDGNSGILLGRKNLPRFFSDTTIFVSFVPTETKPAKKKAKRPIPKQNI